jgi:hypothetical protein
VKKGNWTSDEDYMIFKLYNEYGSKWAKIASFLKGRTENSIKNRFYSTLRRLAYEKQKKENTNQVPRDKFITQKDLLKYLPEAIDEKEYYYKLERQECSPKPEMMKSSFTEDSNASIEGNKKVKVKKIIDQSIKEEDIFKPIITPEQVKKENHMPYPLATPNNINVNFNTAVFAPNNNDSQLNQYLSNLLLFRMNCLENLYNQTKCEVANYNNLKNQFMNMYSMMYGNMNPMNSYPRNAGQ